ncbi:variable large family protein (plasmid) [Borrelia coriaceae]|nr:variable large family protein [Borrelia coriaceae]UPA17415.1 variable large family protein [Borrelia coriaceae]
MRQNNTHKNIKLRSICATLFISLFLSCNSGIEELQKRNTFFDSFLKIGNSFQEILGFFGNTMGDALEFGSIKPDDNRDKVGKHFEKVGEGLKNTKTKLDELAIKISSTPNADTKGIEDSIKGANDVFDQLIKSVKKLAGVTKATDKIGEVNITNANKGAPPADVNIFIEGVQEIIDTATTKSGVEIGKGTDGDQVPHKSGADATAALVGKNSAKADANAGSLLAEVVSKADPWAMINKIKSATKTGAALNQDDNNEVGTLATSVATGGDNIGSKTTADLAAAVALKAMTKTGTFSANNANEALAVKAAAATAVNKVLGILDLIIRQTVVKHLEKIREAVKGIQYSETTGESSEGKN